MPPGCRMEFGRTPKFSGQQAASVLCTSVPVSGSRTGPSCHAMAPGGAGVMSVFPLHRSTEGDPRS